MFPIRIKKTALKKAILSISVKCQRRAHSQEPELQSDIPEPATSQEQSAVPVTSAASLPQPLAAVRKTAAIAITTPEKELKEPVFSPALPVAEEQQEIKVIRSGSKKPRKYFAALAKTMRHHNLKELQRKQKLLERSLMPQMPFNIINVGAAQQMMPAQQEEQKKEEVVGLSGAVSPEDAMKLSGAAGNIDKELHLQYSLTPARPKKGETVFSWVDVRWDPGLSGHVYRVNEPNIDEADRAQINRIKQIIEEKLDIPFDAVQTASAVSYLKKSLDEIITQFGMSVSEGKRAIYEYYILRDFIGLGKLQPMMNDPNIEDISCDGINIPVYIYHRNPLLGSLRTNIVFTSKDELDDFVMRLAQKCGKSISVSEPLSEGALPEGSRVQATLGTDIARRGSNFTVRKFTAEPLTPMHLLDSGTLDEEMLAYFWYAIENSASVLIAGPTASGKTSLLNALSLFIKPSLKIVTIEDTPELKLPHSHWVPEVSRTGFGVAGGKMVGEVSMFDLLKSSMRQRPDYIIVGEVRGEEAYVLFQQMASGHSGLSTIHADSVDKVVDRLTTPPINLPAMLLETLDMIIFIKHMRYRGRYVRRVIEVREVLRYNTKEKVIETARASKWSPESDRFSVEKNSVLMRKLAANMGINQAILDSELKNRIKVISWMKEKKIMNYRDVGRIIAAYYSNPAELLDRMDSGL